MGNNILKVHPADNVIVALQPLKKGEIVHFAGKGLELRSDISPKHKFAETDFQPGDTIYMYGVVVGKAVQPIAAGTPITVDNVHHDSSAYQVREQAIDWVAPDVSKYLGKTFLGYHRADGKVGTRNYWLVIP
ncbi:MAG: altronate dehydratase family protein, partial [Bacteroidia bacterium]|nr:altronate dehydratase family protein [Bacteroidia bacterium]